MELNNRNESIRELKTLNKVLTFALALVSVTAALAMGALFLQSKTVVLKTPGLPSDSEIEKTTIDRKSQQATLLAVTSNLASVNPATIQYQKAFLQAYLSPQSFTKITNELDEQVARMSSQRELGSYYFILNSYLYDPQIDKHFVMGEVHTVNAARDTSEKYVFEYKMHVENYRPVIDEINTYSGDRPHDSSWVKESLK